MKILNFKNFMEKYILKNKTMNEPELQRVCKYPKYLRVSKIYSDKGFVNFDKGSMGGTHWTCFIVKGNKSFYFDTFGSQPDKILLNQLSKPIIYHSYKLQDINSKLCGSFCLYLFYLSGRMQYYDTISKMYFNKVK